MFEKYFSFGGLLCYMVKIYINSLFLRLNFWKVLLVGDGTERFFRFFFVFYLITLYLFNFLWHKFLNSKQWHFFSFLLYIFNSSRFNIKSKCYQKYQHYIYQNNMADTKHPRGMFYILKKRKRVGRRGG